MRGQRAEAQIVTRDGRPPRAHVGREERDDDASPAQRSARSAARCLRSLAKAHLMPSPSDLEPAVPAFVGREQKHEQPAEQQQRPRRGRRDGCGMPLRRMGEDAGVDERVLAEERREEAEVGRGGEQRHDADGDVRGAQPQRLGGEQALVGVRIVEVADEKDRAVLHLGAEERLRATSRPVATRVPPENVSHGVCPKIGVPP